MSIMLIHATDFFFFTAPPPTYIYTLSLHDALPIWRIPLFSTAHRRGPIEAILYGPPPNRTSKFSTAHRRGPIEARLGDRKSTRLNSSHRCISYAVFCLKKKKKITHQPNYTFLHKQS